MNSTNNQPNRITWKELMWFGENLLRQETIQSLYSSIVSTIKEWFSCNVHLWLLEREDNQERSDECVSFISSIDDNSLLNEAIKCQRAIYRPSKRSIQAFAKPLSIDNIILGYIEIDRNNGRKFTPKELKLIDGLLAQSALAIREYQKRQAEQKRIRRYAEQLASILDLGNTISSLLNLDDLLEEAADKIHRNLQYPYVFLFTVHPGRGKIFYQTGRGEKITPIEKEAFSFDLDDPLHKIPLVARTREVISCLIKNNDPINHPFHEIMPVPRTELLLPIIWGEEVLGILIISSDQVTLFSKDELHILEVLAGSLANAMHNATLYRSEQWRRKVAESMREVAGLLTADIELEQVLDRILTELEHTLPCDFAVIWLLEENAIGTDGKTENSLTPAAVHISWQPKSQDENKCIFTPEDVIEICRETGLSSEWLLAALTSDFPLIRTPSSPYEPLGSILDFPENYSSIAAPLRIADRPLGILALGHHTSGRYGRESQAMTATFASYAAMAIENTRLYEAAHDQAWVSTVLLQVAEATQSLNTLDELLETVARITPMLIGVNACVIFLWESAIEAFLSIASYSLDENFENWKNKMVVVQERDYAFSQLMQTKAPVWLNQLDFEQEGELGVVSDFLIKKDSVALIPMIAHGDIRGAFLIDFSTADQTESESDLGRRLNEKLTIIQGIAHQTALAVENLYLLKSQKEEAYVSIALLQVAQAVVSLSELNETLETIVRITPILVGVKRAVIFLWDKENSKFRISQSYGISRADLSLLKAEYFPEEYPLLEAVRNNLTPFYHPYTAETDPPTAWQQITPDDFFAIKLELFAENGQGGENDGEKEEGDSYLTLQSSLLFAYPLAVKGEFLGVMLTQERENSGEIIVYQSRSRRQEITIGITQQAALAIQNDRLQREVVERERIERELQLAREIQQSFLPDRLPSHPGWDLDVLWKPAREVGGDFYDVFELPGNRLGLVIADVADKGMPAALFMTLVRTLIRATAREEISPSAVLEIVNDLLVADTKHGLFITVAYAVISLDTGQIIFANAGHNEPLLLRNQPKSLEILETTGMALGVLEGIHIADLSAQLEPDDCLIFYTDGVTEAFSPEGEMFGESKLREFILSGDCKTAGQQLQAIDQAVQNFISGLPYSDDITILTVRRVDTSENFVQEPPS